MGRDGSRLPCQSAIETPRLQRNERFRLCPGMERAGRIMVACSEAQNNFISPRPDTVIRRPPRIATGFGSIYNYVFWGWTVIRVGSGNVSRAADRQDIPNEKEHTEPRQCGSGSIHRIVISFHSERYHCGKIDYRTPLLQLFLYWSIGLVRGQIGPFVVPST